MSRSSVVAVAVALLLVSVAPGTAWAADVGDVPLATKLAARTHPAVQLVSITHTAKVSVPTMGTRDAEAQRLVASVVARARAGLIPLDIQSMMKAALRDWLADIDRYSVAEEPVRTFDAELGSICTGWWVTPDGYMVTAAHCVSTPEKELAVDFARVVLPEVTGQDVKSMLAGLAGSAGAGAVDEEMVELATEVIATFNATHLKMNDLKRDVQVLLSHRGGGVDKEAKPLATEVVSVGERYPDKDIAILKASGYTLLPTLPLGSDEDVRVGDTFYIDGFPGTVTNAPFLSTDTKLQPTFTEGPYNAKLTTDKGVPYFQTQAPAYGGNSGGPVLNRDGEVIGILVAGLVQSSGETAQNQQQVLPVSIVREKLNERNVQPSAAATTTLFNEALDDYFQKHYKRAIPKFQEVQALLPEHAYTAEYISRSQQAITAGEDETPLLSGNWWLVGAGCAVVLVLLVGGLVLALVLVRRGRRRPVTAVPATVTGIPAFGGAAYGQPGYPYQPEYAPPPYPPPWPGPEHTTQHQPPVAPPYPVAPPNPVPPPPGPTMGQVPPQTGQIWPPRSEPGDRTP